MKRNVLQTLALSTVLVSTALGVLGTTEAQALVRYNLDGTQTEINLETGEERDLSKDEYQKVSANNNQISINSNQSQSTQAYAQIGDNGLVGDDGFNWITPANFTDISQIKCYKNGIPHTNNVGDYIYCKNGTIQRGWQQSSTGDWYYYGVDGKKVLIGTVDGYIISGGKWAKNPDAEALRVASAPITVNVYNDISLKSGTTDLTETQFNEYLRQGKIGVTTQLHGVGSLSEVYLFYLK